MRSGVTLALYIAIGINPAAGQDGFSWLGMLPQAKQRELLKDLAGKPRLDMQKVVVITDGPGGLIEEHNVKYNTYARERTKVRVLGGCYSACTLITAHLNQEDICIAEGAFFAFHAVRSLEKGEFMLAATAKAYWQQPWRIRNWIDRNGGYENLPLHGFWTMYDHELWKMGYPKCP